jgi:drug/metabolite transporter (DMT)-like permease
LVLGLGVVGVGGAEVLLLLGVVLVWVGVGVVVVLWGLVVVVGWTWVRHGQRPRRLTVAGAVVALAGLVLVLDLTGDQHVDLVGVLWGLAAATGLAGYFIISSRTDDPLPPLALSWAGLSVGGVILLLLGSVGAVSMHANTRDADFNGHHTSWLVPVIGLSVVAAAIAYAAGIGAARRLGARLASFVGLAEVLFAVLFAWVLLDERPTGLQLVGGLVVLAGIALVKADERVDNPLVEPQPELAPV